MRFDGKSALITGASAGIGRAAALQLAAEGASLVLAARRGDVLEELAQDIRDRGGRAEWLAGDVGDETYAAALVDLARQSFGGLDLAFNNAGILGEMCPVTDMPLDAWTEVIRTNLTAAMLGAKHQIPAMLGRPGAAILMTSSFVGHTIGTPGMAAYAASKAGMIGLTQVLAAEYGPQGLRVNAILPGGTDTDMARSFADSEEARTGVEELHALKRMASPDEIASTALFLLSDDARFVTGTAMFADGGISITR